MYGFRVASSYGCGICPSTNKGGPLRACRAASPLESRRLLPSRRQLGSYRHDCRHRLIGPVTTDRAKIYKYDLFGETGPPPPRVPAFFVGWRRNVKCTSTINWIVTLRLSGTRPPRRAARLMVVSAGTTRARKDKNGLHATRHEPPSAAGAGAQR
jgi:hypothetical protein